MCPTTARWTSGRDAATETAGPLTEDAEPGLADHLIATAAESDDDVAIVIVDTYPRP